MCGGVSLSPTKSFRGIRQIAGLRLLWLVCVFLSAISAAVAQRTIRVPQDVSSIQAAINAAADGDTALVSPGVYPGGFDFAGKAVTVTTGARSYTDPVVAATLLQGDVAPIATFYHWEGRGWVLNGFTITHPNEAFVYFSGGGGYGYVGANVIDSAAGYAHGTGINNPLEPANASPTISNNRFVNNFNATGLAGAEVAGNYFSGCTGGNIIVLGLFDGLPAGPIAEIDDNLLENNSGGAGAISGYGLIRPTSSATTPTVTAY